MKKKIVLALSAFAFLAIATTQPQPTVYDPGTDSGQAWRLDVAKGWPFGD